MALLDKIPGELNLYIGGWVCVHPDPRILRSRDHDGPLIVLRADYSHCDGASS